MSVDTGPRTNQETAATFRAADKAAQFSAVRAGVQPELRTSPDKVFAQTVAEARVRFPLLAADATAVGLPTYAVDSAMGIGLHWFNKSDAEAKAKAEKLNQNADHPAVKGLPKIDTEASEMDVKKDVAERLVRIHVQQKLQALNGSGPSKESRPKIIETAGSYGAALVREATRAPQDKKVLKKPEDAVKTDQAKRTKEEQVLFTLEAKTLKHKLDENGEQVDITGAYEVELDLEELDDVRHKPTVQGEVPLTVLTRSLAFGRTRYRGNQ